MRHQFVIGVSGYTPFPSIGQPAALRRAKRVTRDMPMSRAQARRLLTKSSMTATLPLNADHRALIEARRALLNLFPHRNFRMLAVGDHIWVRDERPTHMLFTYGRYIWRRTEKD